MGNYLRVFRRRRPPSEELDELVVQIKELEGQLKQLLDSRAWSLKWLILLCFVISTSGSTYYWLQYPNLRRKFLSISTVLSITSLAFIALRFAMINCYDWLIERKRRRIKIFTDKKVAIIEEVKENEKFKVAKEIIEKYGSESEVSEWLGPSASLKSTAGTVGSKTCLNSSKSLEMGSTNDGGIPKAKQPPTKTVPKLYEIRESGHRPLDNTHRTPIRPFVEPSRTPIDRVLDFVMGESINSRFALICSHCYSHNGMALKEEFETISYYCFRCNSFNPSKAELNKRFGPYPNSKQLDFTGHTDESTENEVESERKASTVSLDLSEQEDATLIKE